MRPSMRHLIRSVNPRHPFGRRIMPPTAPTAVLPPATDPVRVCRHQLLVCTCNGGAR